MSEEIKTEEKKIWQIMPSPINKGGRPRVINSPEKLWEKFIEYCKWVDSTPWQDKSGSNSKNTRRALAGDSDNNSLSQVVRLCQRPYVLYEFCSFAGIYKWGDFRRNYSDKKGYLEVLDAIENTIKAQQLTGAILKRYDGNIVARLNGIADTIKNEITGKDGESLNLPKLSEEDFEKAKLINARNE